MAQQKNVCRGDCVHYDPDPPNLTQPHVTVVVGRNEDGKLLVASHGGDTSPLITTFDYRPFKEFRRYI